MTAGYNKVLFTGPVGAGKTTAIRTLSDSLPVMTDEIATDHTKQRKTNTTVAMDYGVLHLDHNEIVHLYGTPGQDRFDFMWEILRDGALGLLLLMDNARPDPLGDLHHFLDAYEPFIATTAVAIGITRTDVQAEPRRQAYVDVVASRGLHCPVFTIDAREYDEVSLLLQSLLFCLDPQAAAS